MEKYKYDLENDELIFKFISPSSNDRLSKIKGSDLLTLIALINKYYLKLRSRINLPEDITFGLEIEYEYAKKELISKALDELEISEKISLNWTGTSDSSLTHGGELDSPIFTDTEKTWIELDNLCKMLEEYATISVNSGGHIHIGAHILEGKEEYWLNFLKLWEVYENIIYRFCYGEFKTGRPSISSYAEPLRNNLLIDYPELVVDKANLKSILSTVSYKRDQGINFYKVRKSTYSSDNTIEFRCPNGSLNATIWQNNVNFLARLLLFSKSPSFDDDTITKRLQTIEKKDLSLEVYNEVDLNPALEICDMIFSNNLDKIYFLKQYLKAFEMPKRRSDYTRVRRLTKN